MKKILCLLIILLGSIGIYAQEEKVLTRSQFDAVYQGSLDAWSLENWKGKSFRIITITHSSLEGRPQTDYSSKWTIEYASPTNRRGVYESSFGDKKSKTESIRLGDKFYSRKDDGDWKEGASEAPATPGMKAATVTGTANEQVEYKFLGTEKLNDRTVKVYAKNVITTRTNLSDGQSSTTTATTKYWFGEDGGLLKSDMVAETRAGEKTYRTLLTQIWESDESIKILAPTLNGTK